MGVFARIERSYSDREKELYLPVEKNEKLYGAMMKMVKKGLFPYGFFSFTIHSFYFVS